jgi:chromate transport protein ChrA
MSGNQDESNKKLGELVGYTAAGIVGAVAAGAGITVAAVGG